MFRLLKQSGTQVNNNNNIFERRASPGEGSKADTMENVEVRQMSCQDGLSQGWSLLTIVLTDLRVFSGLENPKLKPLSKAYQDKTLSFLAHIKHNHFSGNDSSN